jgi:hypothetical protein
MIDQPVGTSDHSARLSAPPRRDPWQIHIAPLALWLAVQLTVLGLSAARVPLWARAGEPIEQRALAQLAIAQLVVAALTFPWVLRNLATSAAIILTAAPMLQLASLLAQASTIETLLAWGFVSAWIVCGALWARTLRSTVARSVGVAVAGVLVIGIPLGRYLTLEFSTHGAPGAWSTLDPVTALSRQLRHSAADAPAWSLAAVIAVAALVPHRFTHTRVIAPSYPQQ